MPEAAARASMSGKLPSGISPPWPEKNDAATAGTGQEANSGFNLSLDSGIAPCLQGPGAERKISRVKMHAIMTNQAIVAELNVFPPGK